MSKCNPPENPVNKLKNTVEVPSNIMNKIIKFEWYILKSIGFSYPEARALATYFFLKTYTENQDNNIDSIYSIISALHLASKVFDVQRPIDDFIKGMDILKSDSKILANFPYLRSININDPEFYNHLKMRIIEAENDIIYKLDFKFDIPLPYSSAAYVGNVLAHWHFSNHELRESFSKYIINLAYLLLNDLQAEHIFYKYPPDIVGLSSIYLACLLIKIPLIDSGNMLWCRTLFPFRDIDEIKEAQQVIYNFFDKHGVMNQEVALKYTPLSTNELKEKMTRYFIAPIEDYREIDELCPPPPLELMKEIAGPEDSFNHNWADHLPEVPPPPLDDLEAAIPPPTSSLPRLKQYQVIESSEPEESNSHPSTPSSSTTPNDSQHSNSTDGKNAKSSESIPKTPKIHKTPSKESNTDDRPLPKRSPRSSQRVDHRDSTFVNPPPPPPPPPHPSRIKEGSPLIRRPARDPYNDRLHNDQYYSRPPRDRSNDGHRYPQYDDMRPRNRHDDGPFYDRHDDGPFYDRHDDEPFYDRHDDGPFYDRHDDRHPRGPYDDRHPRLPYVGRPHHDSCEDRRPRDAYKVRSYRDPVDDRRHPDPFDYDFTRHYQ